MMEYIFLLFVFVCGFGVKLIGIFFLVGYLVVGFLLYVFGYLIMLEIMIFVNFGIIIMLFIIGLKFNIKDLLKCEVWFGSIVYILLWVVVVGVVLIFVGSFVVVSFGFLDW